MAVPASSSAHRPLVLVVTNDFEPAGAHDSRLLARALERLGYPAVVRDTRLNRWGAHEAGEAESARREAFETAVVAKWNKLVDDYGIDLVLSLNADWLLSGRLFVPTESRVQKIHSIWTREPKVPEGGAFSLDLLATLNAPKVAHHCGDENREGRLRAMGIERVNRLKHWGPWYDVLKEILA